MKQYEHTIYIQKMNEKIDVVICEAEGLIDS